VPADMDAVLRLIGKTGVPLIEDCCHAFASTHRDRSLGSMGTAAFWSYEWGKPIIAGVGGEARFNNQELAARAAAEFGCEFRPPPFRKSAIVAVQYLMYSILYGPRRYWPVRNAFRALGKAGIAQSNYNPIGPDSGVAPDFHWQMCGFSSGQIAAARNRAVAFIPGRVDQASIYSDSITSFFARLPIVPEYSKAIYSRFPVFVEKKERLLNAAKSVSLEVADWYATPVHPLAGDDLNLVHYKVGSCPRAEAAARSLVSLPLHPKVTPDFQRDVAELFKRYASA
jgi:perosamine synthetase